MEKSIITQKVIIFNMDKKFLAIRRTSTSSYSPNKWDLPGGRLEYGEDTKNGIIREAKEETGLEIKITKLLDVDSRLGEIADFYITIAYTAEALSDKVVLSPEHNEFRWVAPEEFLKLESPDTMKYFIKNLI